MKRRLYSAFLFFAVLLSLMPFSTIPAYAAANHTYYSQNGWKYNGKQLNSLCYATCIAMSLSDLGKAVTPLDIYINNGCTPNCKDNTATAKDYGVSWSRIVTNAGSFSAAEKEAVIKQSLETGNYPQGIMLYGGGHMVLARKVVNGTVYFDDPAIGCCIPIEKCNNITYSNITLIACFSAKGANGSNNSNSNSGNSIALNVRSIENGNWFVTIPANYKLVCYDSASATKSSTYYIAAQTAPYKLTCTQKATLSNGKVRYFFVSGDNKNLWFDYTSGMSVQDNAATKSYTINFNANGGSVPTLSKIVTSGSTYGTLPTPTRSGYTFDGWYTTTTGGTKITSSMTVSLTGNQTLYAHWISNQTYTVTFNANGGSVFLPSMNVTNGTIYNSLPDPTRDGYTFTGWYTEKSGGSQIVPTTTVNLKGNQTLYAHWTKNPGEMCTVTFEANGGTVSQKTVQVAKGNTLNFLPMPTRSGYTFVCWSNTNGASGLLIKAGDYIVEQDVTLYAWWTKNSEEMCTVTFDGNGGQVGEKTRTVPQGSLIGTLPIPTRDGYDFFCWGTRPGNGGGGEIVNPEKFVVKENVTVYALWREKEVKMQETGYWGPWSSWTTKSYTMSATRQVETKEIQTVVAHMEYRYGRYVDQTGTHNCWCGKYLEGLSYISGKAKLEYSNWSTTRYNPSGSTWTCGQCNGNHIGVDHVDSTGRSIWAEYRLPGNKPYYWEESKIVGAQYETQYRYRDWIQN